LISESPDYRHDSEVQEWLREARGLIEVPVASSLSQE
jgi:hypothetical protein